jgi:AcrR family transcriptional regulator
MASGKRDHLVETALDLFYNAGFHATGIDKILETAGVARMTLYNHFKSKDELIVAVLRRRDEKFRNWFMRTIERLASKPQDRLLAIFDALEEWFSSEEFSGCMFINASAEFADADDPIHMVAAEHKHLVLRYLQELAVETGVAEPEELANELMLLMEGSIVMAYVAGDQQAAVRAGRAAEKLLFSALNKAS